MVSDQIGSQDFIVQDILYNFKLYRILEKPRETPRSVTNTAAFPRGGGAVTVTDTNMFLMVMMSNSTISLSPSIFLVVIMLFQGASGYRIASEPFDKSCQHWEKQLRHTPVFFPVRGLTSVIISC